MLHLYFFSIHIQIYVFFFYFSDEMHNAHVSLAQQSFIFEHCDELVIQLQSIRFLITVTIYGEKKILLKR